MVGTAFGSSMSFVRPALVSRATGVAGASGAAGAKGGVDIDTVAASSESTKASGSSWPQKSMLQMAAGSSISLVGTLGGFEGRTISLSPASLSTDCGIFLRFPCSKSTIASREF